MKISLIRNKKYKVIGKDRNMKVVSNEEGKHFVMDSYGTIYVKTKKGLRFHDEMMVE